MLLSIWLVSSMACVYPERERERATWRSFPFFFPHTSRDSLVNNAIPGGSAHADAFATSLLVALSLKSTEKSYAHRMSPYDVPPKNITIFSHKKKEAEEEDEAGWGFTVKQLATTIHEDSVAYTVSTSSLTTDDGSSHTYMPSAGLLQEVTVRPHVPLASWIQPACYKKWNGKPGLAYV